MIWQSFGRWFSTFLAILALTACTPTHSNEIATLSLSGWQSSPTERQALEQILREFEAQHPQIRVRFEVIADQYMDVIKTRLIGDAAPDVFFLDAFEAPLLMQHGVLEPLDRYIQPDFDLADFEPNLLNAFKLQGTIYGIPKDFSTLALFYNRRQFADANLSNPPQTWEQLRDDSRQLTLDRNRNGRIDQYGLGISPELARQKFVAQAYGGTVVDRRGYAALASRRSVRGLQLIIDQYRQDRTAATPSDVGASSGSEMFGQQRVAMVLEGPWAIPYLQETFSDLEFAIAQVPKINRRSGTMVYTTAYVMNKRTRHKEAAWELIEYLTNKTGMKAWGEAGIALPSRKSVLAQLGRDRDPLYSPFVKGASYATLWQAGENLPAILTHFNNQFVSALLGQKSLQQAMEDAQQAANREIQAQNY
ncbi:MAG: ABC transporter substrate-binding protein [Desertifilum sp.]|nr:ABC transporter substrate-binding protein [Desertifilum sp.]